MSIILQHMAAGSEGVAAGSLGCSLLPCLDWRLDHCVSQKLHSWWRWLSLRSLREGDGLPVALLSCCLSCAAPRVRCGCALLLPVSLLGPAATAVLVQCCLSAGFICQEPIKVLL